MRNPQDADVLDTTTGGRWIHRLPIAVAVAAVIVAVDQLTKWWALQNLEAGSCSKQDACIELIAGVRLHLVYNNGAAFSSGSGYGPIFGVLAFFMSFLLLYLASNQTRLRGLVPFAAIAGGATGNLLDRFFRASDGFLSGAVIDFVDVGWWPVFNFADSAIVVGVAAVILFTAFEPKPESEPEGDPEPQPGDHGGTAADIAATADAETADTDAADARELADGAPDAGEVAGSALSGRTAGSGADGE